MTPDGIATSDWDRVHELAVELASYTAADDARGEACARISLMRVLDDLEKKYGTKPSLLATRADYVESLEEREWLLLAAFTEAERTGDHRNRELTADSLAHFYIEEVSDFDQGATWLAVWRDTLGAEPDSDGRGELARLESILLAGGAA
jgi:hypothetical protein